MYLQEHPNSNDLLTIKDHHVEHLYLYSICGVVSDSTEITGRRLMQTLPVHFVRRIVLSAFGNHIGGFDSFLHLLSM
jgi:hypothetical protein